jgi:hypothetical protein
MPTIEPFPRSPPVLPGCLSTHKRQVYLTCGCPCKRQPLQILVFAAFWATAGRSLPFTSSEQIPFTDETPASVGVCLPKGSLCYPLPPVVGSGGGTLTLRASVRIIRA